MARILLCHQFFWPDISAYGSILRALGEHWAGQGHDVDVFTTEVNEDRVIDSATDAASADQPPHGLTVHRMALPRPAKGGSGRDQALNAAAFAKGVIGHAARNRGGYDLVMISTMPPVLAGAAGASAAKIVGAPFVYHPMDVYPEVMTIAEQAGVSSGVKRAAPLLRRIDSWAVRSATQVVVLSTDVRDTFLRRNDGIDGSRITVLPNFAVPGFNTTPGASVVPWRPGRTRFLFAGNLGRFQGLELLVGSFVRFIERGGQADLAIMGSGSEHAALERLAGPLAGSAIHFPGQQRREVADAEMQAADVCIVSLSPGVRHVAFPTKLSNYLAAGKAVLGLCETQSALAAMINDEGVGIAVAIDDQRAVDDALAALAEPDRRARHDERAVLYGRRFRPDEMFREWDAILSTALQE